LPIRDGVGWQRRRAGHAAALGIQCYPRHPGIWLRTTGDGRQRRYRITEHDGVLYATVGLLLPVAMPIRQLPGHWSPLERDDA
ncbi:MAG: hypothetical protein AB7O55_26015, partial [Lautropia sp.]